MDQGVNVLQHIDGSPHQEVWAEVDGSASVERIQDDRAAPRALATTLRAEAVRALAEKDALQRTLGASGMEREATRVASAWRRAEIALHGELISWVAAHGSTALREQVSGALFAGRAPGEWRPDVPLDWAQAERIMALQPRIAQEWLEQNRPGWTVWQPVSDAERSRAAELRELDPRAQFDWRHLATNPDPVGSRSVRGTAPDLLWTTSVAELFATARQSEPQAVLATYSQVNAERVSDARREFYCATATMRLPGGYTPVQIAFRESRELSVKLDAMAAAVADKDLGVRTYAEKLAALVEVEFGKPLVAVGELTTVTPGTLARIDGGGIEPRAVVVRDDAIHLLVLSDTSLHGAAGKEVLLGRAGEQVFVQPPGAPVAVAYDDLDALQQLALRPEVTRLAGLDLRGPPNDAALSMLESVSLRAEQRLADCRKLEQGTPAVVVDSFLEPAPSTVRLLRDSALATERLAWIAAHGSPELARSSNSSQLNERLRVEWLGEYPGWRANAVQESGWRRVDRDGGPNAVHPAATLSATPPVVALVEAARARARDAVLVVGRGSADSPVVEGRGIPPRLSHFGLIARRMPGGASPEALTYAETPEQKRSLDELWSERHSVLGKLRARVEREYGRPVADGRSLEPIKVEGRLAAVERGPDNRNRAIVVTPADIHIVLVSPEARERLAVGRDVTLEKTAGRVRIVPGRALEAALDR
jgi:hypothetical protein